MDVRHRCLAAVAVAALASANSYAAGPAPPAGRVSDAGVTLTCGNPIAWDATEDALKTQFGADRVEFKDLGGPEGEEMPGTLVNGGDLRRRLEIVWADEAARAKPQMLRIMAGWDEATASDVTPVWTTPGGVKIGLTVAEVEALNGKPFKLSGFGWDYGGMVMSWEGGKLAEGEGTCSVQPFFTPRADYADSISGDISVMSDNPQLRASDPIIFLMTVTYFRSADEP